MKVIEDEDLVDQQLISELRKEYGMTYNDFFMVLTDTDMKVKVRVSALWTQLSRKKMCWKNMKKKLKNLGNYTTGFHVRHIRDWCTTWSLLEDKQKNSKQNFQTLGSYLHFRHLGDLRNCVFLLEWWGTGPSHSWWGFNVASGILKHTVWLLNRMTLHCIRTIL